MFGGNLFEAASVGTGFGILYTDKNREALRYCKLFKVTPEGILGLWQYIQSR